VATHPLIGNLGTGHLVFGNLGTGHLVFGTKVVIAVCGQTGTGTLLEVVASGGCPRLDVETWAPTLL
jgi:hypothetical protein